jgi:hypothetical protein
LLYDFILRVPGAECNHIFRALEYPRFSVLENRDPLRGKENTAPVAAARFFGARGERNAETVFLFPIYKHNRARFAARPVSNWDLACCRTKCKMQNAKCKIGIYLAVTTHYVILSERQRVEGSVP